MSDSSCNFCGETKDCREYIFQNLNVVLCEDCAKYLEIENDPNQDNPSKMLEKRLSEFSIEEIFDWVQNNDALISTAQGAEAFKTIVENGGMCALVEKLNHNGPSCNSKGYWVEISLNTDCAGWSYKNKLTDAIHEAFFSMIQFAIELGYVDRTSLRLIPNDCISYINTTKYNLQTHKIEYINKDHYD